MAKIFMKSSWGSDDPTRAAMVFGHANALAGKGHEVRIFLLGEAVCLARPVVRENMIPVGWPSVAEQWDEAVGNGVRIECCGACSRARGVSEEDMRNAGAQPGNPDTFVESVEWSDKIIAE
ncbi:MAG: DsrE family protein [Gammaproteobacteria bacterium]|nr:DsrE family protein [Gammaproteobacteria bacterium]